MVMVFVLFHVLYFFLFACLLLKDRVSTKLLIYSPYDGIAIDDYEYVWYQFPMTSVTKYYKFNELNSLNICLVFQETVTLKPRWY